MTTYNGLAGRLDGVPLNGARGRRRKHGPLDLVVGHLWGSPKDGPGRYLNLLATPNLPGVSGRVFQSRDRSGRWLWERADGSQTVDESAAKRWVGRPGLRVFRSDAAPLPLISGVTAFPWCFGAGYHGVAGVDGEPHWACDPELWAVNANPPVNDRAVSFCLPGRYQTRHQWLAEGESRDFIRAFAKAVVWANGRFGIPMVRLTEAELAAGRRGYTDHVTVNNVWHQSDHGDLGSEFPWDVLAQDIAEHAGGDMAKIVQPNHPDTCRPEPHWLLVDGGQVEAIDPARAARMVANKTATFGPDGRPHRWCAVSLLDYRPVGPMPYPADWFYQGGV